MPKDTKEKMKLKINKPEWKLTQSVTLVGLMGAGKSTLGKRIANQLSIPFKDTDIEIEKSADMSISEIFKNHGEEKFREAERNTIASLVSGRPLIMATGGGAFMSEETRELLNAKTKTIWLYAELDILVKRCSRRDTRPLLKTGDPQEILGKLIEQRYPTYAEAHIKINSTDGPHQQSVDAIIHALKKAKILKPVNRAQS